jgi:hypothetical protein
MPCKGEGQESRLVPAVLAYHQCWRRRFRHARPVRQRGLFLDVDARKIADLLRCDLLPECYMAPRAMRDLRRVLRYRNLVVRQATRMKNRIAWGFEALFGRTVRPKRKNEAHPSDAAPFV